MKYFLAFLFSLLIFNCKEKENDVLDASAIIDKTISVSGVKKLDNAMIAFDFRDKHYEAGRYGGTFVLKRQFMDATNTIVDYLGHDSFERRVNDSLITVKDSMATIYAASVNSVHYFSVLPYGLDGKAVHKTYLNEIEIKGKNYHKIQVTFNQDGGGEDFEDVYLYWVNRETSKIDYLGYSYDEVDGKGLRFREAYNERFVGGVRFVDYNNFKPIESGATLENLDQLFIDHKLELLSKIELENIRIN